MPSRGVAYTLAAVILALAALASIAAYVALAPRSEPTWSRSVDLAEACLRQLTVNALSNATQHGLAEGLYSLDRQLKALDTEAVPVESAEVVNLTVKQGGSLAVANLTVAYQLTAPPTRLTVECYLVIEVLGVERSVDPETLAASTVVRLRAEDDLGGPLALQLLEPQGRVEYAGYHEFVAYIPGDYTGDLTLVDPRGVKLTVEC